MNAQGDVIRGHGVLPFHGWWEAAKQWARRQATPDKVFAVGVTMAALLGFGLLVYGFYEALDSLKMSNLPPYWTVTHF